IRKRSCRILYCKRHSRAAYDNKSRGRFETYARFFKPAYADERFYGRKFARRRKFPETMRLDAYLSSVHGITRAKAKQMIERGMVSLNGKTAEKPAASVDDGDDVVIEKFPEYA